MNPNYVQLEINGESKGFKFGLGFMGRFFDATGLTTDTMADAIEDNPFKTIPILVYESHKYNEERAKREVTFDLDDVIDWIDDDGGFKGTFIMAFMDAWRNSLGQDVPVNEEPPKKKRPNTTSKVRLS